MRHKEWCLVARNENTAPTSDTTLCSLYKIHICTTYSLCSLRSFESEIRLRGKKLLYFLIVRLLRLVFTAISTLSRRYELSTTQAKSLLQTTTAFFAVELHESPHSVLTLRTSASSNHIFCCGRRSDNIPQNTSTISPSVSPPLPRTPPTTYHFSAEA